MQRFISMAIVATAALLMGAVTQATAQEAGSISGRVIYTDGAPVTRYLLPWWAEGEPIGSRSVLTDDAGNYTIKGLKPGTYFVGLFAGDRIPAARSSDFEDAPSADRVPDQPKTRRVVLNGSLTAVNIDLTITNVGPERGAGPESGPGEITGDLPAAGDGSDAANTPWVPFAVVVLASLGIPMLVWAKVIRGSAAR